MEMLWKVKFAAPESGLQEYGTLATKLLRTYTALARIRRKCEQNVIVKHVHVHEGGQAIVGQVTAGGGMAIETVINPMHTKRSLPLTFAPGTEMRCADPIREPVPVACNEGQEPVSDTRRSERKRRA